MDAAPSLRYYECSCGQNWYSNAVSVSQKCRKCRKAWTGELVAKTPMVCPVLKEDGSLDLTFRVDFKFGIEEVEGFIGEELRRTLDHSFSYPVTNSAGEADYHYYDGGSYFDRFRRVVASENRAGDESWGTFSVTNYNYYVKQLENSKLQLASPGTTRTFREQYRKQIRQLQRSIEMAEKGAALILHLEFDRPKLSALVNGKLEFNIALDPEERNVCIYDLDDEDYSQNDVDDRFLDSIIKDARYISRARQFDDDASQFDDDASQLDDVTVLDLCKGFPWIQLVQARLGHVHLTKNCYVCRFTKGNCFVSFCYAKSNLGGFCSDRLFVDNMYQTSPETRVVKDTRRLEIVDFFVDLSEQVCSLHPNMATISNPVDHINFVGRAGAFTIEFKEALIARLVIEKLENNQSKIASQLGQMRKNWLENDGDESVPGLLYRLTARISGMPQEQLLTFCREGENCVGQIHVSKSSAFTDVSLFSRPDVLVQKAALLRSHGAVGCAYQRVVDPADVLKVGWTSVEMRESVFDPVESMAMKDVPSSGEHTVEKMRAFFAEFCKLTTWADMRDFIDPKTGFGHCQAGAYDPKNAFRRNLPRRKNRRGRGFA